MDCEREFYLCPACFHVAGARGEHHRRQMVHYAGFEAGDAQIKPLQDRSGNLTSRAPRWFVERQWPHALQAPAGPG